MDEFRDDGTRVCPIHGLRFDPELSDGCIKCGRTSSVVPPRKKSVGPKGPASRPPVSEVPPSYREPMRAPSRAPSYTPPAPMRAMTPMVPFEPLDIPMDSLSGRFPGRYDGQGIGQSTGGPGAPITLLAAPERPASRRSLILGLGAVVVAGAVGAAWWLSPESATDWKKKVVEFAYGPGAAHQAAMFIPSSASDEPRPLLILLDSARRAADVCLRFARHCEEHGWIAISSNALGNGVTPEDGAEIAALIAEARSHARVDGGRAVVAGFGDAGEVACRLALVQPDVFAGAILESIGLTSWRDVGAVVSKDVSFFLFTRDDDPNLEKMVTLKDEMERRGLRVGWSKIAGGHTPMMRDEMDPAFAWLDTVTRG